MPKAPEGQLLIATNNAGKLRELRALLAGIPFQPISLEDAGIDASVPETGATYEDNASLKASALAKASGLLTLADDSGLEVDALGGEPGVRSARYAGEDATDADRIRYLLQKLRDVPADGRAARFVCVIAIAGPDSEPRLFTGEVHGVITTEPRGSLGHGYDPVFLVPELGKTMAELPQEVKNRLSHRGRAVAKARAVLLKMAGA